MQCLFPQEIVKNIKTPLFLVHPAYDFWQVSSLSVHVSLLTFFKKNSQTIDTN